MRITSGLLLASTLVCFGCGGDDGGGPAATDGGTTTDDPTTDDPSSTAASSTSTGTTAATTSSTSGTTTDAMTSSSGGTEPGSTTDVSGSTAATVGSSGDPQTDSSSGGSVSTSTGDAESTSSTGDEASQFPPPEEFGDSVLEIDLVGRWALQWESDGGNLVLEIQPTGTFRLTEYDTACEVAALGQGSLWVTGITLMFHFDEWSGQPLWDTETNLGYSLNPPFRMQSSFTLQGSGGDDYMSLVAPETLLADDSYASQSFIRLTSEGDYIAGQWQGEASLEMLVPDQEEPVLAVIDSQKAFIDEELVMGDPEGTGVFARDRTWYPTPLLESIYANFNWTCLNGCPLPAGTTFVAGTNLYTYGPYAGQTHLMPIEDGRTFKRDVLHGCE